MTDDSDKTQSNPPPAVQTDAFLQLLVKIANETNLELGVTLLVGGVLVSGALISAEKYFNAIALNFASPPGEQNDLKESIEALGRARPGENQAIPQFIHLSNAKFYSESHSPIVSGDGIHWRGRLGEVDGFHFGTLATRKG